LGHTARHPAQNFENNSKMHPSDFRWGEQIWLEKFLMIITLKFEIGKRRHERRHDHKRPEMISKLFPAVYN
jgi:hypothetical protein